MLIVEVLCNFCDRAAGISFYWSWEGLPGCPQTLRAFWDDTSSVKPPVDFVGQEMEIGFASKDSISHYMIFNFIEELNSSNSNFQFSFIIFHFQRKSEYSLMVSPVHTIHNPVIFHNSAAV